MISEEAVQIAISLHGAEPVIEMVCWCAIRCFALLVVGMILSALIRACGR